MASGTPALFSLVRDLPVPFSWLFGKLLYCAGAASQSHSVLAKHDNPVLEPAYVTVAQYFERWYPELATQAA